MSDHTSSRLPLRPSIEQLRKQAKELLRDCKSKDAGSVSRIRRYKQRATDPQLADAQFALAREFGFESWPKLVASLEQHPADRRSAPHGLSTRGTLYQIDWKANRLEPRQPLSEHDWDTILGVLREHELTSLDAGGQMTDAVLERLSHQEQITCLRMAGCKQLTDVGVLHLARMPQLVELDLSDHPGGQLTDRGLDVLLAACRRAPPFPDVLAVRNQ